VTCCGIDNGYGVLLLVGGIADVERNAVFVLYGMGRLVAWGGVYRFVAAGCQSTWFDRWDGIAYSWPRKSRK